MFHDPIKMVVVSSISTLILFTVIVVCSKVFKKNIPLPFLLILISILPLISMLRPGSYESGDLSIHASYAISFFESLKEGNLVPVWEKYMISGFGYPYFLFTYPLPYYLASLVHLFGISFISSLKLIAGLSYILSGLAMYLFVKEETKGELKGFIAAIFYQFAPYHLVDLHFRFAIGEIIAFFLLPLTLYLVKKSASKYRYFLLFVFSLGLLILAHQAIAVVGFVVLLVYSIYLFFGERKLTSLVYRLIGIVLGILLSSFYWMPALFESVFTHNLDRQIYFSPLSNYLYSPDRFGLLFQGHFGELYFPIGYIHLPLILIALAILLVPVLRRKYFNKEKLLISILILGFAISFFMMMSISKPFWDFIPFIKGFQFSYRFSIFCALFSSFIAGILVVKIKEKKLIYIIFAAVILVTILNWGNRKTIPGITDFTLKQNILNNQQPIGKGTTIWANADMLRVVKKKNNIDTKLDVTLIKEIATSSTRHEYIFDVKSSAARLTDNTLYFPGWSVIVNNHDQKINEDNYKNGLINFNLKKGISYVVVEYKETAIQIFSKIISVIILLFLSFPLVRRLWRNV